MKIWFYFKAKSAMKLNFNLLYLISKIIFYGFDIFLKDRNFSVNILYPSSNLSLKIIKFAQQLSKIISHGSNNLHELLSSHIILLLNLMNVLLIGLIMIGFYFILIVVLKTFWLLVINLFFFMLVSFFTIFSLLDLIVVILVIKFILLIFLEVILIFWKHFWL